MARQQRLVIPGLAHLISMPALTGIHPFPETSDRLRFLAMLRQAAAGQPLHVHAYALLKSEVRALATPTEERALSHWVQAVGRRYVSAYNKAHARSGTLWAGRFRCAPMQPGLWTQRALRFVDGGAVGVPQDWTVTSAPMRLGGGREWPIVDPQVYWSLGNTPFERETAYRELLAEALPEQLVAQMRRCLSGGWVCGDAVFVRALASGGPPRAVAPRPRGRPASTA